LGTRTLPPGAKQREANTKKVERLLLGRGEALIILVEERDCSLGQRVNGAETSVVGNARRGEVATLWKL